MTTGHCGEGTGETAPWTRAWLPRSAVFRSAHDPFPEWRAGAVQTQQDGNVSNYSLPISPLPRLLAVRNGPQTCKPLGVQAQLYILNHDGIFPFLLGNPARGTSGLVSCNLFRL
jgi:hypothetical protein